MKNISRKTGAIISATTLILGFQSTVFTAFAGEVALQNPLAVDTPEAFIGLVVNIILGLSGSISLLVFVYGGILWMTSAGNKSKVTQGMDTMIWAAVGMAVIFASAAIVRFLLDSLLA